MTAPSRRRAAVRAAAVVLAALGLSACGSGTDPGQGYVGGEGTVTLLTVGERPPAPKVRADTLEGSTFDLAKHRGSVVVLNFWGSWCADCRAEGPALQRVARDLAGKGVVFVGVDTRDDDQDAARAFLRTLRSTYPNLEDADGQVALAFQQGAVRLPPEAIPSTIVVDRQGRLAARILGPTTEPRLAELLRPLAAERV